MFLRKMLRGGGGLLRASKSFGSQSCMKKTGRKELGCWYLKLEKDCTRFFKVNRRRKQSVQDDTLFVNEIVTS